MALTKTPTVARSPKQLEDYGTESSRCSLARGLGGANMYLGIDQESAALFFTIVRLQDG